MTILTLISTLFAKYLQHFWLVKVVSNYNTNEGLHQLQQVDIYLLFKTFHYFYLPYQPFHKN